MGKSQAHWKSAGDFRGGHEMDVASHGLSNQRSIDGSKQRSFVSEIFSRQDSGRREQPQPFLKTPATRPIILLHGFASSPRAMAPLARFLRRVIDREVICIRTSPGIADLRDCSRLVYRAIEKLASHDTFDYVDVIGHSMGGLIASHLLKCLDRGRWVRRVVTLGTPHRGTPLAQLGATLAGNFSRALSQMRPDSRFVRELACLPVPSESQLVSIAGTSDAVVPRQFSELPAHQGHENQLIEGVNHLNLLWAKSVREVVTGVLQRDLPRPLDVARTRRIDEFVVLHETDERCQAA
jgi:pimeloyl-ACP methyl ester carboxylesterase